MNLCTNRCKPDEEGFCPKCCGQPEKYDCKCTIIRQLVRLPKVTKK
jgi:hypothetical protein